ncbi:MAG: hypothetical protein M1428_02110 [Deltaproteobacteria bacterium]|nr:hypothetical protein [Deltaproteobacteria bacterium]
MFNLYNNHFNQLPQQGNMVKQGRSNFASASSKVAVNVLAIRNNHSKYTYLRNHIKQFKIMRRILKEKD